MPKAASTTTCINSPCGIPGAVYRCGGGVVRDTGLWWWYVAGLTQSLGARRDGSVILLTPAGTLAMSWTFHAGLAAKWVGPELNATQNAVAIEGLEIAHEGLVPVILSAPGVP